MYHEMRALRTLHTLSRLRVTTCAKHETCTFYASIFTSPNA
jgi:hypothetical protein